MNSRTINDNIYPIGSLITAKANPAQKLKITSYNQRIYYCAIVGEEEKKPLVFFENELIPPTAS